MRMRTLPPGSHLSARLCLLLMFLCLSPVRGFPQSRAADSLAAANKLFQAGDLTGSLRLLEQTIDLAIQEQNREIEAEARYHLGTALSHRAEYKAANAQLEAALPLFEQLSDTAKAASVQTFLAQNAYFMGNRNESKTYYEKAFAAYESLNDWPSVASMHYSLAFIDSGQDAIEHIQRGLELARRYGVRNTEALLLHLWADRSYATDEFDMAFERLDQARAIFEQLGSRAQLARVYTSIGRLYRVHGRAEDALAYYGRALELQQQAGDKPGVIQSLNAMGVALNTLGRSAEALRRGEEALALARETGSPSLIQFILEAIGSTYLNLNQNDKALQSLEEARRIQPVRAATFELLSSARFRLGQFSAALTAAEEGMSVVGGGEARRKMQFQRAMAFSKLGRTAEALEDIQDALGSIEEARAALVPTDFMKQGFSDTYRSFTNLAIQVLLDSGQERHALQTAEQARGRAFLDLLAAKNLAAKPAPSPPYAIMDPGTAAVSAASRQTAVPALVTRGEPARDVLPAPATSKLASEGSASAASVEALVALAARLNSTIVSYWVDSDSTVIWAVTSNGQVTAARTDYGEDTLSQWIDDAIRPVVQQNSRARGDIELPSRAGDTVLTRRGTQTAWRRLYDALIRPIRSSLPSKGRLTVIPNGPLFRLSFAALMDEKNRYLLEDYALHYVPAGEVLAYTFQAKQRSLESARYVLVSNPSAMPTTEGKALPPLPGSDEEVRRITRLLPRGAAVTFSGRGADETSVRRAIPSGKVIHLATHGIVRNDDPLGSFLAFGRAGNDAHNDGRLTAEDVYGLDLHADLVVLSACRSGLGRVSGDGVAGLARAFFYAGAASVVSTLWDVADEPAAELVSSFYQSLTRSNLEDKSEALRAAQLQLLRSLRRGQFRVDTPFGKLALPEDPILWAGFVLMGEP